MADVAPAAETGADDVGVAREAAERELASVVEAARAGYAVPVLLQNLEGELD